MVNDTSVVNVILPAMAVRGIVPLPNNEIKLDVGREDSLLAIKDALTSQDKEIILLVQKNFNKDKFNPEDLYKIGVICSIISNNALNGITKLVVKGIVRCEVIDFVSVLPFMKVSVVTKPYETTDINAEIACVRMLVKELEQVGPRLFKGNPSLIKQVSSGVTADKLCDLIAFNLPLEFNLKLRYLTNPSVSDRLSYVLEDLKREQYLDQIEADIEAKVRNNINESQKEYYLREKMKTIQEELGDKARKDSEIDELRKKIKECKMPQEIEEKALSELNRYASYAVNNGEGGIIRTYLDFLIDLPWYKEAKEETDINKAKEQLDKDHYGLEKVKERILEYLAVCIMTKRTPQTILCLVGPPGVGKTSLAKSIAIALNRPFVKQSLGGVKDESEIRGHRRTYLGALPGRILQCMVKAKTVNPVFLLDEVDKLTSDYRGDPASALLEVLDPEQNKYFSDNYLEEAYDLSKVFFIATANYLENIPPALRDRMEIVQLSSYTEYEKFEIAKRHLIDKQLNLNGLSKVDFSLSDEALWRIIREYTMEAGVRELERYIGSLIRKGIKSILEGSMKKVNIDENNITEWLGKPKFTFNKIDEEDQVGIVNGLAYTQYGGDTLSIECTFYPGDGSLKLTGKLGDVMKESAQNALSYIKAHAKQLNIDEELFKHNDIHINVPEGAVPKDGPSAGVSLATSIVSAFTNRPVDHLIGMTGEITLRGRVLPIGGLREKSIAAHRSGLKTIIIPKDNVKDIEDVPTSVLDELKIISVSSVDEIFNIALK